MIAGQRIVAVDDSIVRGNTQRAIVTMLREAGAAEVHVRISSPPVAWPCFFGIDFASRAELIAGSLSVEEIRDSIGADSLGYVSLERLIEATTLPPGKLCRACFDGDYPVPVSESEQGKYMLESTAAGRGRSEAGARCLPRSAGHEIPASQAMPALASTLRQANGRGRADAPAGLEDGRARGDRRDRRLRRAVRRVGSP